MADVLLGLGSNVGRPLDNLREAISRLHDVCLIKRVSSLYKTEPVGYSDQDWFLNCTVAAETSLTPDELLDRVLRLEQTMGRTRSAPNGPRVIDIDILLFGEVESADQPLLLPHPRMHEREFVLAPAAEVAAEMRHPTLGATVGELREKLLPAEKVEKISVPGWPPLLTT